MRVLETGSYVVVHFGLCEAGKGGVGDCLYFFLLARVSHSNKWRSHAQNVLISLHNFYLIYYMIFYLRAIRKLLFFFFFFFGQEEAGVQFKHSALEPPDSLP